MFIFSLDIFSGSVMIMRYCRHARAPVGARGRGAGRAPRSGGRWGWAVGFGWGRRGGGAGAARGRHAYPADERGHRKANARVARGRLDQRVPGLDPPRLLGIEDHPLADSILHRPATVEEFALRDEFAAAGRAGGRVGGTIATGSARAGEAVGLGACAPLVCVLANLVEAHHRRAANVVEHGLGDAGALPARGRGRLDGVRGGSWRHLGARRSERLSR